MHGQRLFKITIFNIASIFLLKNKMTNHNNANGKKGSTLETIKVECLKSENLLSQTTHTLTSFQGTFKHIYSQQALTNNSQTIEELKPLLTNSYLSLVELVKTTELYLEQLVVLTEKYSKPEKL